MDAATGALVADQAAAHGPDILNAVGVPVVAARDMLCAHLSHAGVAGRIDVRACAAANRHIHLGAGGIKDEQAALEVGDEPLPLVGPPSLIEDRGVVE